MALCADLTDSTKTSGFQKRISGQVCGDGNYRAEYGLARFRYGGSRQSSFISSYAMFSPGRNWEQIRTTICYNNQNVKIAGAHSGVSVGRTALPIRRIEDIAITRVIPNMVVLAPCDAIEAKKATIAAARYKGPRLHQIYQRKNTGDDDGKYAF